MIITFKNKTEYIMILISMILMLFIAILAGYNGYKVNQYKEYYNKTEALIDSIASQNESFLDTTAEQDVYIEYLEARNKIE